MEDLKIVLADEQKTKEMWGYLAGCVDCDGWISKSQYRRKNGELSVNYRYVVGITQHVKCREGMEYIRDFLVAHGVNVTLTDRDSNTHHHTPMLNITVKQIESFIIFIENIIPRMTFKKQIAIEALEFTKLKRSKRLTKESDIIQNKKRYWKEDEIKIMLDMKAEGYNNISIGNVLDRSSQSVAQQMKRLLDGTANLR